MSDSRAGYTLAEMLAALGVLSLAIIGLAQAMTLIGKGQTGVIKQVEAVRSIKEARRLIEQIVESDCDSTRLTGDRHSTVIPCAPGQNATLTIQGRRMTLDLFGMTSTTELPEQGLEFRYATNEGPRTSWPADSTQGSALVGLEIMPVIVEDRASPLVFVPLYMTESASCDYDPLAMRCRAH